MIAKGILTRDGVHLNKGGNRFLADLVLDALNVPHDLGDKENPDAECE